MREGETKTLHFTLGPVQGFIGDARRVRDFWAGSFLLSWLSGHAMEALEKAGGKIIFPLTEEDELFKAINGEGGTPYIGSLPNRFEADVGDVSLPEGVESVGALCKQAVETQWQALADKVWDTFIKGDVAAFGSGGATATRKIWDRQVDGFWDINWVVGAPEKDRKGNSTDGKWLDQRKNWRTHWQEDEPGDLCRLMGYYQELSGYHRIGGKDKQEKFWNTLAEQEYTHHSTDNEDKKRRLRELNLKEDERLCAIALIKRLFPLIAEDVLGWWPGGNKLSITNWPSTSYIAAVPWLKGGAGNVGLKDAIASYEQVFRDEKLKSYKGETETHLFGLPRRDFFKLDGHLLHEDGVVAWCKENDVTDKRESLLLALKALQKASGGKPSEFYAVLIMDGDNIGARIGKHKDVVKNGLASFTAKVKDYFDPATGDKNPANGVLIYAGGDDVLALVPVDTAIEAAQIIRNKYDEAFAAAGAAKTNENFTMSAAIVFAQYKIPLRAVLKKAHHYLDDIAKDKNGRDSLAIAVMKPGGIAYDWVSGFGGSPIDAMDEIAKDITHYSNSFFYNVRERYAPLFEGDDPHGEVEATAVVSDDPDFMRAILTAEYKKQFSEKQLKQMGEEAVDRAVAKLLQIGQPIKDNNPSKAYHFNSTLVAKFIATEGRWQLSDNKTEADDD